MVQLEQVDSNLKSNRQVVFYWRLTREILKTLKRKDKKHYDVLCKSVGKDETVDFGVRV